MKLIYSSLFVIFAISTIVLPLVASALPLVPCGSPEKPCTLTCFYVMIDNVITFLLKDIAFPLAATALMVSGIMFLFGSSEKTLATAKTTLSYTIIGLFIAFSAWLIIDLILGNLLSDSVYLPWNKFPGKC